jgi:alpha-glucosidase
MSLLHAMTLHQGSYILQIQKRFLVPLPAGVKNLINDMPATWDKTESIIAEPGKAIVLSRKKTRFITSWVSMVPTANWPLT